MINIRYFIFVCLMVSFHKGIGQPASWTKIANPYDSVAHLGLGYSFHHSENLGALILNGRVVIGELDEDWNFTPTGHHSFPYYDGNNWGYLGTCDYSGSTTYRAITDYKDGFVTAQPSCNEDIGVFGGPSYYDGQGWHSLGIADQSINYLTVIGDTLYMAGHFNYIGDDYAPYIAKYNGQNWEPAFNDLPEFTSSTISIKSLIKFQNEWYVGGNFSAEEGSSLLVLRNGSWSAVVDVNGNELSSASAIQCMEEFQGELYVGGTIQQSFGDVGTGLQKWDGENWSEVGGSVYSSGMYTTVYNLLKINDNLYCTGSFVVVNQTEMKFVARWNGNEWCGMQTNELEWIINNPSHWDNRLVGSVLFNPNDDNSHFHIHDGTTFGPCTSTLGIGDGDNSDANSIIAQPNPTTAYITLTSPSLVPGTHITAYNLAGQLVYSNQLIQSHEQFTMDARQFGPAGMYLLHVQPPGQAAVVKKAVVQD